MGAVAWGWRRGRHRVREKDLVLKQAKGVGASCLRSGPFILCRGFIPQSY